MDIGPILVSILTWLVVGLIIGGISSLLVPGHTPGGIIGVIIVGVIGAFVGGAVAGLILGDPGSLTTIIAAFVVGLIFAAVILFFISTRHSRFT